MYHSNTLDPNKALVLNSITKNEGNIRVVFATSSLGCGIDCKNLSYVFHFGPSNSTIEYCQQIGRAGRDTQNICHAVLYTYSQSLRNVAQEIKDYVSNASTSCLRKELFSPFNENNKVVPSIVPGHNCCSYCAKICDCSDCPDNFHFETVSTQTTLPLPSLPSIRNVTLEDEEAIKEIFTNFHQSSFKNRTVPSGIATGLTIDVIEEIVYNLPFISSPECLTEILSVYMELPTAKDVFHIIVKHFKEVD
ncbi:uncharacterized protein [Clytia hemisphaerica]|uniref:uncharacterized protein n=1 Tax=Clytia hemisphaerica TaxID=252671 RepID=UPI0034D4C359